MRRSIPRLAALLLALWGVVAWGASAEPPLAAAAAAGAALAPAAAVSGADPEPGELFVNANRAYEEGDYGRAVELFERLRAAGYGGSRLLYNLGNAYLRNGELGRAIASYRRSQVLDPRNEDVRANLEFARKSAKDALAPPQPGTVPQTLFFWHYLLSVREIVLLLLVVNALFWAALTLRLRARRSETLRWVIVLLLVPLLLLGASLAIRVGLPAQVAVIVPQEVDAHTGPAASTVVRFQLHAGTEVLLRERRENWVRIALPDGQQGWVVEESVEIVEGG